MKRCSACGREVQETKHTQSDYKIDYFEKSTKDGVKVTCVDCTRKKGGKS